MGSQRKKSGSAARVAEDVRGDGSVMKRCVREGQRVSAGSFAQRWPEWGDSVTMRCASSARALLEAASEEVREVSFLIGEAASARCPGDVWSEAATWMSVGEVAEFSGLAEGALELVSWRPARPSEAKEVLWLPEGRAWKLVWREGSAPWLTASAACDVAYRRSGPAVVERPERPACEEDDYVDAFPEADEIYLEPDDWDEHEAVVSPPGDGSEVRGCLARMAAGERATLYARTPGRFEVRSWHLELVAFVEREPLEGGAYKRTLVAAPSAEYRKAEAMDDVSARLWLPPLGTSTRFPGATLPRDDEGPATTWRLDERAGAVEPLGRELEALVEAAVLTMRKGELAEVASSSDARLALVWLVDLVPNSLAADDLRRSGNEAYAAGDHERALRRYDRAVQMALADRAPRAGLHANRAACYLALDRHRDALRAARAALANDPDHVQALRRCAKAHVALGELTEALEPLKRCLRLDPANPAAKAQAADLRAKLKLRKDKARHTFAAVFQQRKPAEPEPAPPSEDARAAEQGADRPDAADRAPVSTRPSPFDFFDPDDDGAYVGLPNRPRRARRLLAAPNLTGRPSWLAEPPARAAAPVEDIEQVLLSCES